MSRIAVERGNDKGLSLNLDNPDATVVVGRLKTCDMVLTDALVSRQHFALARADNNFAVTDLGSHNGTYVNGKRLKRQQIITFGATLRAGETLLVLLADSVAGQGELAGKKVGGYQLIKRIGIGGMGEVYQATQLSLGRQVAIKILSRELSRDGAFVERFLREARAAGKLNHPNVIQVHEAGDDDGIYYFSMEYMDGGSVQDLVKGGAKLDPARATEIVLDVARALEFAEKHKIVHCDIKPDNLMMNATGEVRLADLGIAKNLNDKDSGDHNSDGVYGSPHYMSPEQARGLPVDHRSDQYSLGVTFYRLLLGRVPFTGGEARKIMEQQVFDQPEDPRVIDPLMSESIYRPLTRLLKKKPEERYEHTSELVTELEDALTEMRGIIGRKTPVRRPPSSGIARNPVEKKSSIWDILNFK